MSRWSNSAPYPAISASSDRWPFRPCDPVGKRRRTVDGTGPADGARADLGAGPAPSAAHGDRLRILRSLERGEIDVEEAGLRLEELDRGPGGPDAPTDEATSA